MAHFHVLSDLHLDHTPAVNPYEPNLIPPAKPFRFPRVKADAILNAGDWANGTGHLITDCVQSASVPIITTMGNHDWYGLDISCESEMWKYEMSRKKRDVYILNPGVHDIGDVRVIGCTWWSGLHWSEPGKTSGEPLTQDDLIRGVGRAINDFAWIGNERQCQFSPRDMLAIHERETAFLQAEVSKARSDGKVVVVMTHFGPSRKGIAKRFEKSLLNPYFFNDREDLTVGVSLWVHGHTHTPCDFVVAETGCRIICNPKGYGDESQRIIDDDEDALRFRPDLVMEVKRGSAVQII